MRTLTAATILTAVQPPTDSAPRVIALFGPTAVGKTDVALALADRLRARGEQPVAVSADALQVYRGLEVLTGVPGPEELARLEHRLVSIVDVGESFSVAQYAQRAHADIDALLDVGARPIVVGGTGLYLRAALAALDLRPPPDPAVRARLDAELAERGAEALHADLARAAPWAAASIGVRDRSRIVRALELQEAGALHPREGPNRLWTGDTRHPTRLVGLTMDRDALRARIDARVDAMLAAGAAEEVRRADAAGASPTARVALGFRELLHGDVEAMKRATHRLARRQLTWMRKLHGVRLLDATGRTPEELAAAVDSPAP
jgi:tRNA dimethylallyltransferase